MTISFQFYTQILLTPKSVFHRILNHRLKYQLGNPAGKHFRFHIRDAGKAFSEPVSQDRKIILQVFQIFPKCHLRLSSIQAVAQKS